MSAGRPPPKSSDDDAFDLEAVERTDDHDAFANPLADEARGYFGSKSVMIDDEDPEGIEAHPSEASLGDIAGLQDVSGFEDFEDFDDEDEATEAFDPVPGMLADLELDDPLPFASVSRRGEAAKDAALVDGIAGTTAEHDLPLDTGPIDPPSHAPPPLPRVASPPVPRSGADPKSPVSEMTAPDRRPALPSTSRAESHPLRSTRERHDASAPAPVPQVVATPTHRPTEPLLRQVARLRPERSSERRTSPEPESAPGAASDDHLESESTTVFDSSISTELPRGRLMVIAGDDVGRTFYLNRAELTVGRGADNDIVQPDIAVSRRHVRILRHERGFRLVDLNSGNGSYVNGRRISEAELYDGDRVEIGNTVLDFGTLGKKRCREDEHPRDTTDPGLVRSALPARRSGRVWTIVGTVVLLGATFGAGMFVTKLLTGHREEVEGPARTKARTYFDRAAQAIRARSWEEARKDIELARDLAGDLFDYGRVLAEIDRGVQHRAQLATGRDGLGKAEPESIRAVLSDIGPDSVYYADAEALVAEASRRELLARAAYAERLLEEGRLALSQVVAEEIVESDSDHPRGREVLMAVKAAIRDGDGQRASAADTRARDAVADGLRRYRGRAFEPAMAAFGDAAAARPSTTWRRRAEAGRQLVGEAAEAWSDYEKARAARQPELAIAALGRAEAADGRLGAFLRKAIRAAQGDMHAAVAREALDARRYREAVIYDRLALEYAPENDEARALREKLTARAHELLVHAQKTMSNEPNEARRLARTVLAISDENDEVYRDAYKLLQQIRD